MTGESITVPYTIPLGNQWYSDWSSQGHIGPRPAGKNHEDLMMARSLMSHVRMAEFAALPGLQVTMPFLGCYVHGVLIC